METLRETLQEIEDIREYLLSRDINLKENSQLAIIQRLGYRKVKENLWGKPFGTGLITIEFLEDNKCKMTSWFINKKDEVSVWASDEISTDYKNFHHNVCFFEGYHTKPRLCDNFNNDFGFFTREEKFLRML
jgi:hypothetical protein